MKNSGVKDFRLEKLKTLLPQYAKNFEVSEKVQKHKIKTDIIEFKGKSLRNSFLL